MPKIRVFFDTSVLFAAAYSSTGAARDLIKLALDDRLQIVVSQDVLEEARRNLLKKAPEKIAVYRQLIELIEPEIAPTPSKEEVQQAEKYVAQKDAPIIAAAIKAQPDYLATYDRKDLLDPPQVAANSGLRIVTPDVIVAVFRNQGKPEDN